MRLQTLNGRSHLFKSYIYICIHIYLYNHELWLLWGHKMTPVYGASILNPAMRCIFSSLLMGYMINISGGHFISSVCIPADGRRVWYDKIMFYEVYINLDMKPVSGVTKIWWHLEKLHSKDHVLMGVNLWGIIYTP